MSDIQTQIENRTRNQRRSVTRDNAFPIQQGGGYFQILIPAVQPQTSLLPQYLPPDYRTRDRILDSTVRADAMWSAAIGIAITKAAALAWEVKSDVQLRSTRAQELLLNADATNISGIGGWVSYMGKQVRNFTCTNAGCFTEIIRATGAYGSRIVGLGHLSSLRVRRTGDPEYPYIYIDRWGHQHVMRWWQVFNLVDMPDPDEAVLGMGLCAAERAYQQIRKLAAIETYIYEKVSGSRPLALHIVNGLTQQQLQDMMASASQNQAQKGLSLYMGAIVATTLKPDSPPGLVTIPLAELPDGFEADKERERADLIYANALGLDPQDLRPISNQQLGAGAQSQVLNQKAEGRGQAAYRQQLTHMLNQLVLDDKTKFIFTEHDYQDQKSAADVSNARAGFVNTLVTGQIITAQQGQQILAEQNEIPKAILEAGVGGGSQLSDTDKPDVEPEFNDISMPTQPTTLPVMQTQTPVAPPSPPPTTPPAPQPVQKAVTERRSTHAAARRLLRQIRRGGSITHKADSSGGVWRMIHGHPVLIKGGGGGGGGGGGVMSESSPGPSSKHLDKAASLMDRFAKGEITRANYHSQMHSLSKATGLSPADLRAEVNKRAKGGDSTTSTAKPTGVHDQRVADATTRLEATNKALRDAKAAGNASLVKDLEAQRVRDHSALYRARQQQKAADAAKTPTEPPKVLRPPTQPSERERPVPDTKAIVHEFAQKQPSPVVDPTKDPRIADAQAAYRKAAVTYGFNHPATKDAEANVKKVVAEVNSTAKRGNPEERTTLLSRLGDRGEAAPTIRIEGMEHLSETDRQALNDGVSFYKRLVGGGTPVDGKNIGIRIVPGAGRACYEPSSHTVFLYSQGNSEIGRTAVHELGHATEDRWKEIQAKALNWRNQRTEGETETQMSKLLPMAGYGPDEPTKKDKFYSPYVGRIYGTGATEVTSMAIERMYHDPIAFAHDDPEHFQVILEALQTPPQALTKAKTRRAVRDYR